MRSAVAGLAALLSAFTAPAVCQGAANVTGPVQTDRLGFFRAGDSFGCTQPANQSNACLSFGEASIGDNEGAIRSRLGSPVTQLVADNGQEASIYALVWAGPPQASDLETYLAVTFDDEGLADSLQISGAVRPTCCWTFSGIMVGDPVETLIGRFGRAFETAPVSANRATLWTYGVWPFSFEVLDGKVISVRIVKAEERSAPASAVEVNTGDDRGQREAEARAAGTRYRDCVRAAAVRLERSREEADVVARASIQQCQEARTDFLELSAGDDWRYANALGRAFDDRLLAEAEATVVGLRARRR